MRTTSRLAVSAAVLGGGLLLAAPVSAQEATSTPCPYPFDNCPTASPSVTASPTESPTTSPTESPTTSPTESPTTSPSATTAPPLAGGGENPATSEQPPAEETAGGGGDAGAGGDAGSGGGGGAAVVDNSPVRGAVGGAASLPFTGGEVTLLALTGTAAVAGGLVLVAAGRRRATS